MSNSGPRRAFISHTSELAKYPQPRAFVAAAVDGVCRAQDAPVLMKYFPAADQTPASVCTEQVQACGVFVGVIGFRYGSPVRDQPGSSYVEWEFEAATQAGLTRLVFLVADDAAGLPREAMFDGEFDENCIQRLGDIALERADHDRARAAATTPRWGSTNGSKSRTPLG